jgi:transcriptional regulator with XRE-family HTH domain
LPRYESVGQLFKVARRKRGLTQRELAERLGIKLSRLQKWESGVHEPSFTIEELRRIRHFNNGLFEEMMRGFVPLDGSFFSDKGWSC